MQWNVRIRFIPPRLLLTVWYDSTPRERPLWPINVARGDKRYLSLRGQCPIYFSDYNYILNWSTRFS